MKIHFTLILLILVNVSFSQNKKKQIEYLNLKLDSLNYVIEQERKIFSNQMDVLKQNIQKAKDSNTKKITDLTRELTDAKSQLQYLKNDQKTKQQKILNQQNKIKQLNKDLENSKMFEIDFPTELLGKTWSANCSEDGPDETRVTFKEQLIEKENEGVVEAVIVSFYEGGGEVLRIESNNSNTKFLIFYLSYPEYGEELLLFEFKLINGKLIRGEGEYQQELIKCN